MVKAVIFDVDGTLIDSVDLHAKAWQDALQHFGKMASLISVRNQIGKGGDELLPIYLSGEELEKRSAQIKDYRSLVFRKRYLSLVEPFAKVRELFISLKGDGLKIAIGSSAKKGELDHYLDLLQVKEFVDVKVCSDDANRSKPQPDIFERALEKLGLKARETLVIGDSPYDAEAASNAGIQALGFLCGGFSKQWLMQSGMREIYADPADFLENYKTSSLIFKCKD